MLGYTDSVKKLLIQFARVLSVDMHHEGQELADTHIVVELWWLIFSGTHFIAILLVSFHLVLLDLGEFFVG